MVVVIVGTLQRGERKGQHAPRTLPPGSSLAVKRSALAWQSSAATRDSCARWSTIPKACLSGPRHAAILPWACTSHASPPASECSTQHVPSSQGQFCRIKYRRRRSFDRRSPVSPVGDVHQATEAQSRHDSLYRDYPISTGVSSRVSVQRRFVSILEMASIPADKEVVLLRGVGGCTVRIAAGVGRKGFVRTSQNKGEEPSPVT